MTTFLNYFQELRLFFQNFLFPVTCISCGKGTMRLCQECLEDIPHEIGEIYPSVYALFPYRHTIIRKSLRLLKYSGAKEIAEVYGRIIFETLFEWHVSDAPFTAKQISVMPIPLSKKRRASRGFNQSERIAEALCLQKENTLFVLEKRALIKIKETKSQVAIKNRSKRLGNLHSAFIADEKYVRGKYVLVIDDITTTGATFTEAKRVLKKAGAKKVICFAIAH